MKFPTPTSLSRFLIAVLSLIVLSCGPSWSQGQEADLDRIFADWQKRQDGIRSVRIVMKGKRILPASRFGKLSGVVQTKYLPQEDKVFDLKLTLSMDLDKNKIRTERSDYNFLAEPIGAVREGFYPFYTIHVSDGTGTKSYEPKPPDGATKFNPPFEHDFLYIQPEIYGDLHFFGASDHAVFFCCGIVPESSGVIHGRGQLSPKKLRLPINREAFHIHGKGLVDGRECMILRTKEGQYDVPMFWEIWVDVPRDSAVVRWASYYKGETTNRIDIQYKQADGLWVPSNCKAVFFDPSNPGDIDSSEELVVTEFSINPTIDDSEFTIATKPGMIVSNEVEQRKYVVAQDGITLIELDRGGNEVVKGGGWPIWVWAGIALGMPVIGLGLWIYYKTRKQVGG